MTRTTMLSMIRIGLLCAGIAACMAAYPDAQPDPDSGCVKTRCFTPTCMRDNAGGYYMQCPPGPGRGCVKVRCNSPDCTRQNPDGYSMQCPAGVQPPPKSQRTAPPEADRSSADSTPDSASQNSAQTHLDPAAVQALKGDWEFRVGAVPKPMAVLHLRPGAAGTLEGSLEQSIGAMAQRVPLQDIEVSGSNVTYTTSGGNKFHGTLSNDGQTIVGDAGSPTWQRVKP